VEFNHRQLADCEFLNSANVNLKIPPFVPADFFERVFDEFVEIQSNYCREMPGCG
jgi:hypothetical protein